MRPARLAGARSSNLAEAPEHAAELRALLERAWPAFITRGHSDTTPDWLEAHARWPALQLLIHDEHGALVAAGSSVPLASAPTPLPDEGWDWAVRGARAVGASGDRPTVLAGLSVTVAPEARGRGLSSLILDEMVSAARARGMDRVIIPVRPTLKPRYPLIPMARYIQWERGDGSPMDPWLRVHTRMGGRILGCCERSMTIDGTVAEWESWLDLALPASGTYTAPGLLAPLTLDREADRGVYVEPNVWVVHAV